MPKYKDYEKENAELGPVSQNPVRPKLPVPDRYKDQSNAPVGNKWPVETVGGENQTYKPGDTSFIVKEEKPESTVPPADVPEAEKGVETSIDELRSRYLEELMGEYERSLGILRDERDEALRENWILQQQALAALPEQMAAAGINGGAAETSIANIGAEYQGNRNDIQSDYMKELSELAKEQSGKKLEAEKDYSEKWMEYLMNLAKMEKEHEYDMELERFR